MARRATEIKRIRSADKNVLLLSGGDVFTGTLWYKVYRGNASRKFMNELGYDAMTFGNHEFDDGVENLVSFLRSVNFTIVASNLNVSQEPKWPLSPPLFVKSKVFEVGGEKIGIVGYVLKTTPLFSRPGPGPNIKFLPEVESVRSAVEELKKNKINKIIAVGHAGIDMDNKVANEVDGIDIVVGGHTNTFLYTGPPPSTETPYGKYPLVIEQGGNPNAKALVVQAFKYGKYLGHLKVEFDADGHVTSWSGNPILLDSSIPKDPVVLQQVQRMKVKVTKLSKVKVGSSLVFLDARVPDCFRRECNFANVVTDAFVFHYASKSGNHEQWTNASIAIQTSKSVTTSIAEDVVTFGDIVNSCPSRNVLDVVELRGKDLLQVFEKVASSYDENKPSPTFLQVSGLQITYDMSRPSGQRVASIKVRCASCSVPIYKPLDEDAVYKVILPSNLAQGKGGFNVIRQNKLSHKKGDAVEFEAASGIVTRDSFLVMSQNIRP
ncbi:5'-nucleotidase-like isoform X2 [Acropora muricata]|uniref:5'-nucleotidase-like isoform X2 n=1 Tax=Acropora muricata TaxID=159855 RepID=UPI0034E4605F